MPFYLTVTDLDTGGNPQTANGTVPKGSGPREGFETAVDGYSVAPSKGLLITCTFKDGIFFENLNYADWIVSGIRFPTDANPCDVTSNSPLNPDLIYAGFTIYDSFTETRYECHQGRILDTRAYQYDIMISAEHMDPNNGHIDVQVNFKM